MRVSSVRVTSVNRRATLVLGISCEISLAYVLSPALSPVSDELAGLGVTELVMEWPDVDDINSVEIDGEEQVATEAVKILLV